MPTKNTSSGFSVDRTVNLPNLIAITMIVVAALAAHFRMEAKVGNNAIVIAYNQERIDRNEAGHERDRTEIIGLLQGISTALREKADKPRISYTGP